MDPTLRRAILGLIDRDVTPVVAGDARGDYTDLATAIDGQAIRLAPGADRINPLDCGDWTSVTPHLADAAAARMRFVVADQRTTMLSLLIGLVRGGPVTADEAVALNGVMHHVTGTEATSGTPTLSRIATLLKAPAGVARAAVLRLDHPERRRLRWDLDWLIAGAAGDLDGPTTTRLSTEAPMVTVDLTAVASTARTAALAVTWGWVMSCVDVADHLADIGLGRRHRYLAVYPNYTPRTVLHASTAPFTPAAALASGGDST